jgi:microcystin degradation protein MlrC
VGIIGIYHESNTFIPEPTTLEHYRNSTLLLGENIRAHYGNAHHEVSGFFQTLAAANIEAVPIIFAHTSPWGKVTDEALDTIWRLVCEGLDQAGPLDGILAAPHGAAVNESRPDMDGWWLGELRKRVGPGIPVIATMDPHVNISAAMAAACDAAIAYRENPHLDQRERGIEAATLMVRTLRGEIRPVCAGAFPPVAINIERQFTGAEPMLSVQRELDRVRETPGILSASVAMGFPYADVAEMGSAFVVVADNDPGLAREQAEMLGDWLTRNRERFRGEITSPAEALARIADSPKPVGLLDMGDNMGGGAPSDSTVLAHLCEDSGSFQSFVCLADAESAKAAREAGIGARLRLKLGGKLPMTPAPPLDIEVTVLSLHDGKYTETQPRHGGKTGGDMGPTAVVKSQRGLTIMLTTRRTGPFSLQPLLTCGVQPADFDVIIIKGVHAPIGAYAEACPTLIRVNTPGVTLADMESLPYLHRRRPLFPFEEI